MIRRLENGVLDRDHTIVGPFLSIEIYRELLSLKKRKRGKRGRKEKEKGFVKIRAYFFHFLHFSNSRGMGDFLGWTQGQTERKKRSRKGEGGTDRSPCIGSDKIKRVITNR